MKRFLSQTLKLRPLPGLIVALSVFFNLSVSAQVEKAQIAGKQTVSTMQITSANVKPMPANTSMADICDPYRKASRQKGNVLIVECKPARSSAPSRVKAKPDVQRSEVNCKYTENDEGGFDAQSCTCKADSDSNCTGFITWCAKQGGDVGGNNQGATCD